MSQRSPNGQLAQAIMARFEPGYAGFAVDIGASDGITCNSTYMLEAHRWTVLSVEANPDYRPSLNACRAWVESCAVSDRAGTAVLHVNTENPEAYSSLRVTDRHDLKGIPGPHAWQEVSVPVFTLDELLFKWDFPRLDALCVDTEGTELDVLRGCDLAYWTPRVIVTECWDAEGPIDDYLRIRGYRKIWRLAHNDLFVRSE